MADPSKTLSCKSCGEIHHKDDLQRNCCNCFACTGCEIYICPNCQGEIVVKAVEKPEFKK